MRFALELLVSHAGEAQARDLSQALGREVLGYISKLSPNVRKYSAARGASLADLAALSEENEATTLKPQTQARIWGQLQHFLDWCVQSGELEANPWEGLTVKAKPEVSPHGVLTDAQVVLLLSQEGLGAAQHTAVLPTDRAALWGSLWVAGRGRHQQGEPGAVRQGRPQ